MSILDGTQPSLFNNFKPNISNGYNENLSGQPTVVKCILIGDKKVGKTSLVVSYISNDYPLEYEPSGLDTFCVDVCADSRPVRLQICDAGGKLEANSLRQISYAGTHVILLCFSVVQPESFRSLKSYWLHELANAPIVLNPVANQTARRLFCHESTNPDASLAVASKSATSSSSSSNITHASFRLRTKTNKWFADKSQRFGSCSVKPGPAFLLVGCACDLRNDISRLLELSQIDEQPVDRHKAEQLALELGAQAYVECSALTQKNLKVVFDLAVWLGLKVVDSGGPANPKLCSSSPMLHASHNPGLPNGGATIPNPHIESASLSSLSSRNQQHFSPTYGLCDAPFDNCTTRQHSSSLVINSHLSATTPSSTTFISSNCSGKSKLGEKRNWRRFLCLK